MAPLLLPLRLNPCHVRTTCLCLQHAREEKLAVLLGALLRRYVEGDVEGFQVGVRLSLQVWLCGI